MNEMENAPSLAVSYGTMPNRFAAPRSRGRRLAAAFAVTTLLTTLLGACAGAPKPGEPRRRGPFEAVPLVGTFEVLRTRLDNGLTLLVVEDHRSPTFAYQTWYDVGSRDENPRYTGLAHLFEHMMFKETKSLKDGEFDRIMERAGSDGFNAFTNFDYTAYVQELPADKLELMAKLESDRMVNLVINEKAFKTETEVVQNERRMRYENNADGTMYHELFGLAFRVHPYRFPVIGLQEDLDRMGAKDAEAFYRQYYRPNHATVAVVGDVDPREVLRVVKRHYEAIPSSPPLDRAKTPEPAQTEVRRKTLRLPLRTEKRMIGWRIPALSHPDAAVLSVLRGLLTGGGSSRLERALVDTGIATSVSGYELDNRDPTLFIVAATLQRGKKAAQAESVILNELARLARDGVSEEELARAKNALSFEFYQALEDNMGKANFLGQYSITLGRFERALDAFARMQAVTPADARRVAQAYLQGPARSVIYGKPKSAPAPTQGAAR
jgi:zinc protease